MRGHLERSGSLFSYVSIEERIPASHPLQRIRKLADHALDRLTPTFCALCASETRADNLERMLARVPDAEFVPAEIELAGSTCTTP